MVNATRAAKKYVFAKKPKSFKELNLTINKSEIKLEALLKRTKTMAFLFLKNDTLVYENYFMDTNPRTNFKAFSMSKSILSALVGIAIDEGKITDVHQKVGSFKLGIIDKRVNDLTIERLLLQNTQLQYNESYTPWADEPRWYYTLHRRSLARKVKLDPVKPKKYENVEYNNYLMAGCNSKLRILSVNLVILHFTKTTISR